MAWTQTDLDAVEAAIASGELEVQYSDKSVRYRSITELLRARDVLKSALAAAATTTPVPKQVRVVSKTKGF